LSRESGKRDRPFPWHSIYIASITLPHMEHTPLIAKETGGTDFKIIEPGNYIARCYSVVDLGTTHNPRFNIDSRKVRISFEMPTELETFKSEK
jgi:hypothetical protein